MIIIKARDDKSKRTFRAKGSDVWTVRIPDENGDKLSAMKKVTTETCLAHLDGYISKVMQKEPKSSKRSKKSSTQEAAKTRN